MVRRSVESLDRSASFAAVHFRRSTCALCECEPRRRELLFDEGRQREIEVVAARSRCSPMAIRSKVSSSCSTRARMRLKSVVPPPTSTTRMISGEALRQLPAVRRDPGVERGERFFEQRQPLEARRLRRFDRQLAPLRRTTLAPSARPAAARAARHRLPARGCGSRRRGCARAAAPKPRPATVCPRLAAPRQQRSRPIDVRVREPGFRRRDQSPGNQRSFVAGEDTGDRSGDRSHGSATAPNPSVPAR